MNESGSHNSKIFEKLSLNDHFVLYTCILSAILGVLYVVRGVQDGFKLVTIVVIAFDFLYVPLAIIFKRKSFVWFCLVYALVLVFIIAFTKTYLYNNFTSLFIICVIIMIQPKFEIPAIIAYFIVVSIAFTINDESLLNFFIHLTRSLWFIIIVSFVVSNKFQRKSLILYEDEIAILKQLADGKHYQKEVEGFSENTIYRKLKAARERNGNITREELVELFKKEYQSSNQ